MFMNKQVVLLIISGLVSTQVHAELSLATAIDIAQRLAPEVDMLDASVRSATDAETAAGRLPDPRLALGIDNVPATGDDQWRTNRDPMTMKRIGLMQEIPNHGKREAQREIATASIERARAERAATMLSVRRSVAVAWFDRYYLEKQAALLDDLDKENDLFAQAVRAQIAAGKGKTADGIMPQQEAAMLANRRDELTASITKATAMLRRWIGDAANQPLSADAPNFELDSSYLRDHVHLHPELSVYEPMLQSAQASLHQAEAEASPDWGVELFYSRRDLDHANMVSLQFSIGLPVAKRYRQAPNIAASRETIKQIQAQREQMLREHVQDVEADLAEYESLTRQYQRMQDTRIPLAQQKVALEFAAYKSGQAVLDDLLQARRELLEEKMKLIQLEQSRAVVSAKLHFTSAGDRQ
jgi:cobalt-zinc-cadmium efflux system outer membrane protein